VPGLGIEFHADVGGQLDELAVDARPDEALAGQPFNDVAELALLIGDHGREQHHARPGRQGEDFVHDIARGLGHDGHAGLRTMRLADVGVEQAQVIVDLGGGGGNG
jgi:hypothetical protein